MELNFDPTRLRFIETRSPDDKRPKHSWGGYNQDFDDADHVHTYEDIQKFPQNNWAVVDVDDKPHMPLSLLVFDLDIHKAPEGFDPTDIKVPSNTLIVKSQSGGLHVYFIVHARRSELSESDFAMTHDLGWDIDIRGSAVSAHIVAPSDIPGVETPYTVENNESISTVTDPADACSRIQYNGEALLEYNPDSRTISDIEIDRRSEPPEDFPTCYHRGLELRAANPEEHPNTHKVNVLTALSGLYAGYDPETVVDHFVEDFAPGKNADREKTEYQVNHLAQRIEGGEYSPPSITTLRDYGILSEDEGCDCQIEYHGGNQDAEGLPPGEIWEWWAEKRKTGALAPDSVIPTPAVRYLVEEEALYNADQLDDEEIDQQGLPAKAHNSALYWLNNVWAEENDVSTDGDGNATARSYMDRDTGPVYSWEDVRYIFDESTEQGRHAAEALLRGRYEFMTIDQKEDSLHVYDEDRGIYTESLAEIRGEIHDGLGEHWSRNNLNEIMSRLEQKNIVEPRELNGREIFDDPHICVENGVLNLFTRELKDHSPDYYFVDRVPHRYDPEADTTPYRQFLDDVTGRAEDAKAMMEMVGHALVPDAHERGWKKFMILHGNADNGKSFFYDRVTELLDGPNGEEDNVMSVKLAKMSSNRFSKNSMYGHMANIAGEINGKKIRNTADIKDITGGDRMEIEPKGGQSFADTMNTTLMFAANDPPIIGERDKKAIATRIVPIELPYEFTEDPVDEMQKEKVPERELLEELGTKEAMSGLLNLALEGIERMRENYGDVSLPETPMERLKRYEESADPMKEFGEACLTNDPDAYLAKADITTIYEQFATEEGYPLGSNTHDTLHGALKNVQGLNYTESRPTPDYNDTDLPLRGWDERKYVVDRVSLTEEGLEYAEKAGLVREEGKEAETEEEARTLAAIETGRDNAFTAEVVAVSDGEYSREAQGLLKGPNKTTIGFVVPGGNDNPLSGKQGTTLQFETVTIRTDEDGLKEAVINDAVEVTEVEGKQSSLDDAPKSKATDGGGQQFDQLKPQLLHEVRMLESDHPKGVTAETLAGELDEPEPKIVGAIDSALEQGELYEPRTDHYRTT